MSKPKLVVTRRWPAPVETCLRERYDVTLNETDEPLNVAQLQDALRGADALCPTVSDRITAEVIEVDGLRAKLIANYGVGYNHIDLDAAKRRGLIVTNTPEVLTDCTADLAMTLMLMVARRAGEGERHVRSGAWTGWRPTHMMGSRVTGKTLGLVGFGRIARAMARKARFGFDMRILFHDPLPPPAEVCNALGATGCASVEDLLRAADFVALHCPGGAATRHLMNAQRLALMKPEAFLINTARGDVIDQAALVDALVNRRIAGAGLDVYDGEPQVPEALKVLAHFSGRAPRDRIL